MMEKQDTKPEKDRSPKTSRQDSIMEILNRVNPQTSVDTIKEHVLIDK